MIFRQAAIFGFHGRPGVAGVVAQSVAQVIFPVGSIIFIVVITLVVDIILSYLY
jgi:hypothetical protein